MHRHRCWNTRVKTDDELAYRRSRWIRGVRHLPAVYAPDGLHRGTLRRDLGVPGELSGEDSVGIGTDFTQGQDAAFFDWLSSDKGTGRRLIPQRPGVSR